MSPAARAWCSGLLAACLFLPQAGSAGEAAALNKRANFEHERASRDTRAVADWIVRVGDNRVGDNLVGEIGTDSHGEDVLWLDYEGALAMHRVITTVPSQRRAQRLATPTTLDNRISYGCINIPVKFYEEIVQPSFTGTMGIVYVLPESKPLRAVFASYGVHEVERKSISRTAQRRASGISR